MASEEKLAELMSQGRMIAASDQVIYPLIQKKIQERLSMACAKFTGGEQNFLSDIAYISALKQIETELKSIQKQGSDAYLKLNKEN